MKNKIVLATGIAVGYVLGSRSGRESYEKLKTKANELWKDPKVQDKVSKTTQTLKNKAPEVKDQASEAAKKIQDRVSHSKHASNNGQATETGPSGGDPYKVEPQPFQAQSDETRPSTNN
ncbi:YtxH domain-containing protein [Arthrobacter monumenti]